MWQEAERQKQLFEERQEIKLPRLPEQAQQQAIRLLTQWMEALANSTRAEVDNEQD